MKAAKIGAALGSGIGVLVFAGYALASWWFCSGSRSCPDHWLPYAIVVFSGVALFAVMGTVAGAIGRAMYQVTRVDGGSPGSEQE